MIQNENESKHSLVIWRLNSSGESIPMPHNRVLSLLETVNPGKWGQNVLDLLMSEGWVKCTVYGTYDLTPEGLKERRLLHDVPEPIVVEKPVRADVDPWGTFRKIVGYYAECVKQQEKSQQYLFNEDYGKKYFLPVLPYGWLKELGKKCEEVAITINRNNQVAINTILSRKSYEEDVYIGYPIEAFYHKGKTHYVPIALIPVDVRSDLNNLYIKLRTDEADINHSWLEYHIKPEEHKALLKLLTCLHKDDKYQGLIDVQRSLPYLETYARGCTHGMFDSDSLQWVLPRLSEKGSQSCNCAALFVGTNLQYSRTLIRELRYIAQEPDEVLDTTALAYVFREPLLKNESQSHHYAFPFIGTNDEQQLAVTHALNNNLTLVTGPPGTGKSQVAVNIIANHVLRKQSVLFTSRNHKAVHAIAERSSSMLKEYSVDLVNFCSTPDGKVTDEWFKKDVELLIAKAEHAGKYANQWHFEDAMELDKKWGAVMQGLCGRDDVETELSILQSRIEELDLYLRHFLGVDNRLQDVQYPSARKLKSLIKLLGEPPTDKTWRNLWSLFLWKIRGAKNDAQARRELAQIIPAKVHGALRSSYIKSEIELFLETIKQYREQCEKKSILKKTCEKIIPLKEALQCLQYEVGTINSKLKTALIYSLSDAVAPYVQDDELKKQLKNLQYSYKNQNELLMTQGVNQERVAESVIEFKRFLNIAPAWATTLLSLTRSAPCLPAVFDAVIIDEASQCDVPPMIPALYRAKKAVIVGDPQQFPPVVTMKEARNEYLLQHHHLSDVRYSMFNYCMSSAYSVIGEKRIMLTNHYRCHPGIADYFNDAFYNNRLNVCTAMERLVSPSAFGLKQAVDWADVSDSIEREIETVVQRVAELARNGYTGSVGVVTPLREYANLLDERLNQYRHKFNGELIVNTVNAFQGGEKDVIVFMLSYTSKLKSSQLWYLTSDSNRYIYNVAVSRARACLVVVGDRKRCAESNSILLRKLADLPRLKTVRDDKPKFDSVWEERLYNALMAHGIKPWTQYHLGERRLDMAIITDSVKLDIEVDGVRWHTAASGGRKVDDLWRDIQVTSAGWQVLRFWVYQLEENMDGCIQEIKLALMSRNGGV